MFHSGFLHTNENLGANQDQELNQVRHGETALASRRIPFSSRKAGMLFLLFDSSGIENTTIENSAELSCLSLPCALK